MASSASPSSSHGRPCLLGADNSTGTSPGRRLRASNVRDVTATLTKPASGHSRNPYRHLRRADRRAYELPTVGSGAMDGAHLGGVVPGRDVQPVLGEEQVIAGRAFVHGPGQRVRLGHLAALSVQQVDV